ncbi:PhzF family phenazine biosynthesis protein [Kaistia dalseonensis]|uniref:Trans-2,3-dihydro-3-hydroxyanthranilate isomerase n=1 Tax=Kaistia dalseonensis TaxID=410840 RepID=A0ABU0HBL7_9HYPH|nr:PhzF family phenazine biosynthesis protein [Kaistia dalseonensis]MCX5497074.1 PhzF family phenazine biosynthesis protein [Kaistia dalseonensis]MDQ0439700.1 trans-2,3-dihydro-3-hydroxyanthranilate isomerase [Kaistia dalseonensis]
MSRRYVLLDVFANRPLEGNQLAVVLDSEGLDGARMQAIAAEFNIAETVFVLPPERPGHRARIRIFTPARELPFAGHPTVGSAVLLALEDFGDSAPGRDAMMVLEEEIGFVRCAVALKSQSLGHAIFDVPSLSRRTDDPLHGEAIAAALGLTTSDLGFENHTVSGFSAGKPYIFVPVRDLSVMARLRPQAHLWEKGFPGDLAAYVYTRETTVQDHHFRARMFWLGKGFVEDPATGSAAAGFAGPVLAFDQLPTGTHRFFIEQGFEMGRPSLIALEIDVSHGALHATRIGGDAVVVGRGMLDL